VRGWRRSRPLLRASEPTRTGGCRHALLAPLETQHPRGWPRPGGARRL